MSDEEQKNLEENIRFRKRFVFIPLGIIVAIGFIFAFIYNSYFQSTDDAYVENHMVNVAPKVAGQLIAVYVQDNQLVHTGDLVAQIDDRDYVVKANQARAQYEKALAAQKVAHANFQSAQTTIANAQADYERYQKLYEAGAISKQELDNAQTKFESTKAGLVNADENLIKGENSVADADIKVLKALKDKAELDLSYTKIYAPQEGTVSGKKAEVGAYVQVGSPLFALVPKQVWVVANFKENQVGKMKKGQIVDIKIDAYPHQIFKGRIDSIQRASGAKSSLFPPENAVGSFVKIVQRIPVKIVFDESIDIEKYNIVPGMSVVPKVRVK